MFIVPASALSTDDLALLGNNLGPARRHNQRELEAVNRSLSAFGEELDDLDCVPPVQPFSVGHRRSRRTPRAN